MAIPKLTKRQKLLLLVGETAGLGALAVILLVFAASTLDGYLLKKGQGAAVITSAIFDLTNTDRRVNNVGELRLSPSLSAIAQAKADDMAANSYFAHTSPEGKSPWYWFKQGGYIFTYAGENLAIDFSDSADVERAWMNSPTHRANILNGQFTEIGLATAQGTYEGHPTTYVVQEFATPAHPDAAGDLSATPSEITSPNTKPTDLAIATTKKPSAEKPAPAVKLAANVSSSTPAAAQVDTDQTVLGSSAEGLVVPKEDVGLGALWNDFAASPRTTLRYAYYLFGLIILIALIIETGIEIRRHHIRHVALVVALLAIMSGLFFIADTFVFTNPILAESTLPAESAPAL